jgi:hypothetical protein
MSVPCTFVALLLAAACSASADEAPSVSVARDPDQPSATVGVVTVCAGDLWAHGVTAVAEPSGQAVGARALWAAPGEPAVILFDCSSGAAAYRLRPSQTPGDWRPRAGVTVESRRRVDGPAETWDQACALWPRCTAVDGRTLVPNVFSGIDPCGDTRDFGADYHGWFRIDKPGDYRFASDSDDASFVAVDGKPIVNYGGWHGPDARHGEKNGTIRLDAGVHEVEYLYFQNGDNPIIELAWQPPGAEHPEIMPPAAFLPISRWHVESVDPNRPWIEWEITGSSRAGGDALVEVALRAHYQATGGTAFWRFDDGSESAGPEAHHVFARGGLRRVTFGFGGGSVTRDIDVHPQWTQIEEWSEPVYKRAREDLAKRDPLAMPPSDVLALVRFASFLGDAHWIQHLGKPIAAEPKHWGPDGCELLGRLGFELQDADVREYDQAAACWRALLELSPGHSPLRDHAALHFGGLLVHGFDRADEAASVLEGIDANQLDGGERRLLTLYRGDAALAKSDLAGAEARYREAGEVVARSDLGYAVRRRTRLEAAKDWCARGEWEQALQAMREIEWETPSERLGTETGLLKVRAYLGRRELPFALACCKHMLIAVGPDEHRADVLLALVEVCLAGKQRDQAVDAARTLIKDHPYSEAAAKAKDLLPEVGK